MPSSQPSTKAAPAAAVREKRGGLRSITILDGEECSIRIPKYPGSAGHFLAFYLVGQLQSYSVTTEREQGSKEYRADPFAAQYDNFLVKLVHSESGVRRRTMRLSQWRS